MPADGKFQPEADYQKCRAALTTLLNAARQAGVEKQKKKEPGADDAFELAISASTLLGWLGFYHYERSDDILSWNERDQAQGRNQGFAATADVAALKKLTMRLALLMWVTVASACALAQPQPADNARATIKDCAVCPEMMAIPAGQFVMGAGPDEEARENLAAPFRHRSQPQRRVTVKAFSAAKFEVTRGQYRAFAEATGHSGNGCFVWNGTDFEIDRQKDWRNPGYAQDDTHPVVCVSWDDASAYVKWLGQQTGKRYRLLTEAEWEYAARAGTSTARFWGDDANQACNFSNGADLAATAQMPAARLWDSATCNDRHAHTAPAGSYRANAFGLHDMLGNVGEWTQDCWNANYHNAPADQRAWVAGDCAMRVVRGGAWDDAPTGLRAAYRVGSPTTIRLYSRGFRVARDDY